jgi:hypothetical protein
MLLAKEIFQLAILGTCAMGSSAQVLSRDFQTFYGKGHNAYCGLLRGPHVEK